MPFSVVIQPEADGPVRSVITPILIVGPGVLEVLPLPVAVALPVLLALGVVVFFDELHAEMVKVTATITDSAAQTLERPICESPSSIFRFFAPSGSLVRAGKRGQLRGEMTAPSPSSSSTRDAM